MCLEIFHIELLVAICLVVLATTVGCGGVGGVSGVGGVVARTHSIKRIPVQILLVPFQSFCNSVHSTLPEVTQLYK